MKLGPNIARNIALRENVFMMAVCIELRIPLFLVGKPGSSKSLAKSIVADSMLGRSSEKDLLKDFKQVRVAKLSFIDMVHAVEFGFVFCCAGPDVLLPVQPTLHTRECD